MNSITNSNFLIASKAKEVILRINNVLCNIPRKDYYYKDQTNKYSIYLLEYIYEANECKDIDRLAILLNKILTNIAMIDFLLERFMLNKYINEKSLIKICELLIEIKKMCVVWINKKDKE